MSRKYQPKSKSRIRRAKPLLVAVGSLLLIGGCSEPFEGLRPCGPDNCGPNGISVEQLDMAAPQPIGDLGLPVKGG